LSAISRLSIAINAATLLLVLGAAPTADCTALVQPRVFRSVNGVLDLLMIAQEQPVPTISFDPPGGGLAIHPKGWVYQICPRPVAGNICPADYHTSADYGGSHLELQPGDVLKIRLVNRLPAMDPNKVKHGKEAGQGNLFRNPTNLHTHGLLVAPREASSADPTFGDYVFVQAFNSANGTPDPQTMHPHGAVQMDVIDYRIDIPTNHPAGLYWFHPHIHGISLNQVSAGLSGLITIGAIPSYIEHAPALVRYLTLKDMQVLASGVLHYDYDDKPVSIADGEVQNQQLADFCEAVDKAGPDSRLGYCDGEPNINSSHDSLVNSRWFFTINGQVYPTIRLKAVDGELWRLTNASAQVSYGLQLVDDSLNQPMLMQLVAIDGVSVSFPAGTPPGSLMALGGNKFTVGDCAAGTARTQPVCISDLVLMPGARAELWVTYRNSDGVVIAPPPNATATLKQISVPLGRGAESWPQLKLAKVVFAQTKSGRSALNVTGQKIASAVPSFSISSALPAIPGVAGCRPLADGHHRRIFFGVVDPTDPKSPFGLGYEEVDRAGTAVPGSQIPVSSFDYAQTMVCLPLDPSGTSANEPWELINLSTETHNFHIHQAKFSVFDSTPTAPPVTVPQDGNLAGILEDNVPVPFGTVSAAINDNQNGYCTVAQWRAGECTTKTVTVLVRFTQAGEFVFHCHILEHEDSGMMAKIRVVPAD
jgi:L-ascorbate oxidase